MTLPTGTLLQDTFTRANVAGSWGVATDGHVYAVNPSGQFNISANNGEIILNGTTVRAAVPNVANAADHDGIVIYKMKSLPSTLASLPTITTYVGFRVHDVNNKYRLRIVVKPDNTIWLQLQRVNAGVATNLTANVQVGAFASTAQAWVFRYQVYGADTPTLRAKAWINGSGEPSTWSLPATLDPAPLTGVGGVEYRAISNAGSAVLGLELGEWLSDDISAVTPPPNTPVITGQPPTGHVSSGTTSVSLAFSSTTPPAVDHYETSEDGTTFATHTSPYSLSLPSQGVTKTFYVRAVDSSGNASPVAQVTITRDNATGGTTTNTYTPVAGDVGAQIRGSVKATAGGQSSGWVHTALTPAVTGPVSTPTNSVAPVISGSTVRGSTLVCDGGTWSDPLATKHYQWMNNGVPITGAADSPQYQTQPTDDGDPITCSCTAQNSSGTSAASVSNTITVDSVGSPPVNTTPAQIQDVNGGQPVVGDDVTMIPGVWDGTQPITLTYTWKRSPTGTGSWTRITGATGPVYTLADADAAQFIEVTEHADNGF